MLGAVLEEEDCVEEVLREPLLLFFFATLLAEDLAQVVLLSFESLTPANKVLGSFKKCLLSLSVD